jgi:serine/threonine-protein kinase RsbW
VNTQTIVLPSDIKKLTTLFDWVETHLPKLLQETLRNHVLLVTQEIATNAMIHGNAGEVTKNVTVLLAYTETYIQLKVTDEGTKTYNLPSKESANIMNTLEESGRGLKLAVLLCDEIYKEGRTVIMKFTIT